MLHYMTILFSNSSITTEEANPGLLPCRNAEMIFHTRTPADVSDEASISQLVVHCKLPTNP
jgi:hypothetical protein